MGEGALVLMFSCMTEEWRGGCEGQKDELGTSICTTPKLDFVVSLSLICDWPLTSSYAQSRVFNLSDFGNAPDGKGQKLLWDLEELAGLMHSLNGWIPYHYTPRHHSKLYIFT